MRAFDDYGETAVDFVPGELYMYKMKDAAGPHEGEVFMLISKTEPAKP